MSCRYGSRSHGWRHAASQCVMVRVVYSNQTPNAPILQPITIRLIYIPHSFCLKGENLEIDIPAVIDYTPYLKYPNRFEWLGDRLWDMWPHFYSFIVSLLVENGTYFLSYTDILWSLVSSFFLGGRDQPLLSAVYCQNV